MEIKPIRNQRDYHEALRRIRSLWGASPGSRQSDELDILATLVEAYESEHYPIEVPSPIDAIKFRLEQSGMTYRDLVGVLGQRTRVYEVMRGARPLSLRMIRNLHRQLGIPADVLIQQGRQRSKHKRLARRAVTNRAAVQTRKRA